MDTSRLGTGATIAAIAAIVLLVSMFLPWFQLDGLSADAGSDELGGLAPDTSIEFGSDDLEAAADAAGEDTKANAWESFGLIDLVLLAAVAVTLGFVATRAGASARGAASGLANAALALGVIAAALILFRIVSPPDLLGSFGAGVPEGIEVESEVGRQPFLFVGFIAAAALAFGAWRAMQDEPRAPASAAPAATPPPPPPSDTTSSAPPGPGTPPPPPSAG